MAWYSKYQYIDTQGADGSYEYTLRFDLGADPGTTTLRPSGEDFATWAMVGDNYYGGDDESSSVFFDIDYTLRFKDPDGTIGEDLYDQQDTNGFGSALLRVRHDPAYGTSWNDYLTLFIPIRKPFRTDDENGNVTVLKTTTGLRYLAGEKVSDHITTSGTSKPLQIVATLIEAILALGLTFKVVSELRCYKSNGQYAATDQLFDEIDKDRAQWADQDDGTVFEADHVVRELCGPFRFKIIQYGGSWWFIRRQSQADGDYAVFTYPSTYGATPTGASYAASVTDNRNTLPADFNLFKLSPGVRSGAERFSEARIDLNYGGEQAAEKFTDPSFETSSIPPDDFSAAGPLITGASSIASGTAHGDGTKSLLVTATSNDGTALDAQAAFLKDTTNNWFATVPMIIGTRLRLRIWTQQLDGNDPAYVFMSLLMPDATNYVDAGGLLQASVQGLAYTPPTTSFGSGLEVEMQEPVPSSGDGLLRIYRPHQVSASGSATGGAYFDDIQIDVLSGAASEVIDTIRLRGYISDGSVPRNEGAPPVWTVVDDAALSVNNPRVFTQLAATQEVCTDFVEGVHGGSPASPRISSAMRWLDDAVNGRYNSPLVIRHTYNRITGGVGGDNFQPVRPVDMFRLGSDSYDLQRVILANQHTGECTIEIFQLDPGAETLSYDAADASSGTAPGGSSGGTSGGGTGGGDVSGLVLAETQNRIDFHNRWARVDGDVASAVRTTLPIITGSISPKRIIFYANQPLMILDRLSGATIRGVVTVSADFSSTGGAATLSIVSTTVPDIADESALMPVPLQWLYHGHNTYFSDRAVEPDTTDLSGGSNDTLDITNRGWVHVALSGNDRTLTTLTGGEGGQTTLLSIDNTTNALTVGSAIHPSGYDHFTNTGDCYIVFYDGTDYVVSFLWNKDPVFNQLDIIHVAEENDDHAFEIDTDAAGFSDVKAIDLFYDTGAIGSGEDEAIILVQIDESDATGGDIMALEVLATEGLADKVTGLFVGAGVGPVEHLSGVFADADSILVKAVDQLAALSGGGAGNVSIFVADNDTMTIGRAALFEEIEFLLDTTSSGAGIAPTFEFSTGVGTWSTFGPIDGTNGMRNNGIIVWLDSDIPTWAQGTGSEYLIRITRTRNNLGTTPIADKVQIAATTEFYWDKDGDVVVRKVIQKGETTAGSMDATPDVSDCFVLISNNSAGATSVTDFDTGGGAALVRGTDLIYQINDANTTIVHGSGITLPRAVNYPCASGDELSFRFDGTDWILIGSNNAAALEATFLNLGGPSSPTTTNGYLKMAGFLWVLDSALFTKAGAVQARFTNSSAGSSLDVFMGASSAEINSRQAVQLLLKTTNITRITISAAGLVTIAQGTEFGNPTAVPTAGQIAAQNEAFLEGGVNVGTNTGAATGDIKADGITLDDLTATRVILTDGSKKTESAGAAAPAALIDNSGGTSGSGTIGAVTLPVTVATPTVGTLTGGDTIDKAQQETNNNNLKTSIDALRTELDATIAALDDLRDAAATLGEQSNDTRSAIT